MDKYKPRALTLQNQLALAFIYRDGTAGEQITLQHLATEHGFDRVLQVAAQRTGTEFRIISLIYNKRFGFLAKRSYGDFASCMLYNPSDEDAVIPTEFYKLSEIAKSM